MKVENTGKKSPRVICAWPKTAPLWAFASSLAVVTGAREQAAGTNSLFCSTHCFPSKRVISLEPSLHAMGSQEKPGLPSQLSSCRLSFHRAGSFLPSPQFPPRLPKLFCRVLWNSSSVITKSSMSSVSSLNSLFNFQCYVLTPDLKHLPICPRRC